MILIFAGKVMRLNLWLEVYPDRGGFSSSAFMEHVWKAAVGQKVLGQERRMGRECIQSLGVFRQWGPAQLLPHVGHKQLHSP